MGRGQARGQVVGVGECAHAARRAAGEQDPGGGVAIVEAQLLDQQVGHRLEGQVAGEDPAALDADDGARLGAGPGPQVGAAVPGEDAVGVVEERVGGAVVGEEPAALLGHRGAVGFSRRGGDVGGAHGAGHGLVFAPTAALQVHDPDGAPTGRGPQLEAEGAAVVAHRVAPARRIALGGLDHAARAAGGGGLPAGLPASAPVGSRLPRGGDGCLGRRLGRVAPARPQAGHHESASSPAPVQRRLPPRANRTR